MLPDSDTETDSYGIGCYCFLKKSVQWTYADSYSEADGYCIQFDTDIDTDKVFLNNFQIEWKKKKRNEHGAPD